MSNKSAKAMLDEEVAEMERQYYIALERKEKKISKQNSKNAKDAARKRQTAKNEKARKERYRREEQERVLAERQQRIDGGDEYGFYRVILTKNYSTYDRLGNFHWLNDAQRFFEERIAANKHDDEAMFPITASGNEKADDYEILLIQTESDGQPDFESVVKNETTNVFERNKVEGDKSICILRKAVWLMPETFAVVGYHPRRDRKTAFFIYNEFIKPFGQSKMDIVTVGTWGKRLYIRRDTDINFVNCASRDICVSLYNFFRSYCYSNKNILFIGECSKSIIADMKQLYETKSASLC